MKTQLLAEEPGSYFCLGLTSVLLTEDKEEYFCIYRLTNVLEGKPQSICLWYITLEDQGGIYFIFHLFCLHTIYFLFFYHQLCHLQYLTK